MAELKLTIELVPNPLWGRSLYHRAPPKEWKRLRKEVLARTNSCCGICGAGGRMTCHEIWYYDDENHIQRLTGLIALCDMCNNCKHLGRTENEARKGGSDLEGVVEHFCRVNGISREVFNTIRRAAFNQWNERNKYTWTQDFGEYSGLVP